MSTPNYTTCRCGYVFPGFAIAISGEMGVVPQYVALLQCPHCKERAIHPSDGMSPMVYNRLLVAVVAASEVVDNDGKAFFVPFAGGQPD